MWHLAEIVADSLESLKVSGVVARGHQEVGQLGQLVLGEGGRVLSPVVRVGPLPVLDRLLDRG